MLLASEGRVQRATLTPAPPYHHAVSWTPPPGTVGITYSYGWVGCRATLGQLLIGETARYSHAFVVLDERVIIEPWPSGARITLIDDYAGDYVAYGWLADATPAQRKTLASCALSLDGVKHGLTDYAALALKRMGWRGKRVTRRAEDTRRLLPVQFIAETYRRAGLELVPGADPAMVTLDQLADEFMVGSRWRFHAPCAHYA